MKVLEYQRPRLYVAQESAIFANTRFAAVEASTKAGKSVGCLAWIVVEALTGPGDGATYPWIAPAYSLSQNMYRRTKRMLGPEAVSATNESDLALTLVNGAQLWYRSGDRPDLLYGFDSHGAVIDEASRVSEEAWHAVRSTLSATGGRARLIGNVSLRKDWFWKLCREVEAGLRPDWVIRPAHLDGRGSGRSDRPGRHHRGPQVAARSRLRSALRGRQPADGLGLFNTERLKIVPRVEADPYAMKVRAWDLAASATSRSDYTVDSLMHRALGDEVSVLDIRRGRWEPEAVLAEIVSTAATDGPTVEICIEEEKASSGKLLNESIRRRLEDAGVGGIVHSRFFMAVSPGRSFVGPAGFEPATNGL